MRHLVGAALAALLAGCALFVSGEHYGTVCQFGGESTPCGACVRAQCQDVVNACCADGACASSLADLDACAGGDAAGCKRLEAVQGSAGTRSAMADCVTGTCRATCSPPTSLTRCTLPILGGGATCRCELSNQPTDQVCNAQVFPDTVCCAPDSWPAEGQRCSCMKFECGGTNGCLCRLDEDTSIGVSECAGTHCCVRNGDCTCGEQPCTVDEQQVPSCTITYATCPMGQKVVDTCSIAR